jgi:hypothetical protein
MQMIDVESSMLSAVGYDPATQTLRALFNSGKTYDYFEVPQEVYDQLIESDSKGHYMNDAIIDLYPYRQVKKKRR